MLAAACLVPFGLCLQENRSQVNDEQHEKIAELKNVLDECKAEFFGNLNFTLDELTSLLDHQESTISVISDFVGGRQCE